MKNDQTHSERAFAFAIIVSSLLISSAPISWSTSISITPAGEVNVTYAGDLWHSTDRLVWFQVASGSGTYTDPSPTPHGFYSLGTNSGEGIVLESSYAGFEYFSMTQGYLIHLQLEFTVDQTLGGLIGADGGVFLAGGSAAVSDTITIYDSQGGAKTYYYMDGPSGTGWRREDDPTTDYSTLVIPARAFITIFPKDPINKDLALVGQFIPLPLPIYLPYHSWIGNYPWWDPLGPNAAPNGNPDGDTSINMWEFLNGTHPFDPSSTLRIDSIAHPPGQPSIRELHWQSVAGKTYRIQDWTAATGSWSDVTTVLASGTNSTFQFPIDPVVGVRLFRLSVVTD